MDVVGRRPERLLQHAGGGVRNDRFAVGPEAVLDVGDLLAIGLLAIVDRGEDRGIRKEENLRLE